MLDFDNEDIFDLVLQVCRGFAVDPMASLEAEDFFRRLLSTYTGADEPAAIRSWLEERLAQHFVALQDPPRWLQTSDWQFEEEQPMLFVGQIDIPQQHSAVAASRFHDDTSFYIFVGREGPPRVIMQQM
ncbi:MAG TPA: hypothetical protein VGD69_02320 [Herpetosiphonaceae bacterium]